MLTHPWGKADLEEEAVQTYTRCIKELDEGKIPEWEDKLVRYETRALRDHEYTDPLLTPFNAPLPLLSRPNSLLSLTPGLTHLACNL